jgi:cytoskeletal protein CcmA (bactofilin family)
MFDKLSRTTYKPEPAQPQSPISGITRPSPQGQAMRPQDSGSSETRSTHTPRGTTPAVEGSRLIVGPDIRLKGEIEACDTLVVEGRVEASMDSRVIEVAESGIFKGEASVDTAEISGRFEGTLTVRERLVVRATGKVSGEIHYKRIQIEEGGVIAGTIQVVTDEMARTRKGAAKVKAVENSESAASGPAAAQG